MTKPFETISLAQVARLPRPGMSVPGAYRFTPDSSRVLYLHSSEGSLVRSLWSYDITSGARTELAGPGASQPLSREEELRRERERIVALGVTDYAIALAAATLTIMIPGAPLIRVIEGDQPARGLPGTEGAIAPQISPNGRNLAFVREGELHALDLSGGPVKRLTHDAEDGLTNGLAEFIAQEELDRSQGFWWSPDSSRIAFIQADERHVARMPIVHQGRDDLDIEYHRYPFAGDANARLCVGILSAEGDSEPLWLDLGTATHDIYIPDVAWRPDGHLAVQVLSRDQRQLTLALFDGTTGEALARLEERSEPWLNVDHSSRFLRSNELLWTSERTDFRHLYLYDEHLANPRALTAGDWMVTRIVAVDEERRLAYFEATRESVLERHLYRVSLEGGEIGRLTDAPGWHSTAVSRDGDWFIDSHASRGHGPVATLRPTAGGPAEVLWANEDATADALGLREPILTTVEAADGTPMHVAIYQPPTDGPSPAIVSVYGGPHAQRVMDEWSLTVDLRAQYLAQQGFVVIKVDNRGSANRGLAFEAPLYRRMGTVEVDDQATAVRELARRGLVDASRVGIYGWSYGGYMTCMCMAREPELFRVGVAGAPVTHWDGYDTCYTERYMSTPAENPEGYADGAVMTHVAGLTGKLLLVHGLIDENVHFRHTARLVTALNASQKPYDLLVYPEERHVPRDAAGLEYQERRLSEYFEAHL